MNQSNLIINLSSVGITEPIEIVEILHHKAKKNIIIIIIIIMIFGNPETTKIEFS